jgi:hypothetical protein
MVVEKEKRGAATAAVTSFLAFGSRSFSFASFVKGLHREGQE